MRASRVPGPSGRALLRPASRRGLWSFPRPAYLPHRRGRLPTHQHRALSLTLRPRMLAISEAAGGRGTWCLRRASIHARTSRRVPRCCHTRPPASGPVPRPASLCRVESDRTRARDGVRVDPLFRVSRNVTCIGVAHRWRNAGAASVTFERDLDGRRSPASRAGAHSDARLSSTCRCSRSVAPDVTAAAPAPTSTGHALLFRARRSTG